MFDSTALPPTQLVRQHKTNKAFITVDGVFSGFQNRVRVKGGIGKTRNWMLGVSDREGIVAVIEKV